MYRIRMHGRGGQGMKTACRILGTAFFEEGFEVQDAPRYGAERRGAPMFAYVRAHPTTIYERGIIVQPDLVVVSDDSLLDLAAAGVFIGLSPEAVLAVCSSRPADVHRAHHRLNCRVIVFSLPPMDNKGPSPLSSCCAGAAAALLGLISVATLARSVAQELHSLPLPLRRLNQEAARAVFAQLEKWHGIVEAAPTRTHITRPLWQEPPLDPATIAAPTIHTPATSMLMHTGAWRTRRPQIDTTLCISCGLCDTYCPDGAITMNQEGKPLIDYDHCKGCLICMTQCPAGAISDGPDQEENAP